MITVGYLRWQREITYARHYMLLGLRWIWLHERTRRAHRLDAPTEHYRRTVTVEFDGDTLLRAWSKEP